MQRAAVSVPGNIAAGSAEELRYYLILPKDPGYQPGDDALWKKPDQFCGMLRRFWEKTLYGA